MPGRTRSPTAFLLALVVGVLVVYLPALRNGFVWDDFQYVVGNEHVGTGLTPANLRWALTSFDAGNWHPLTWFSHLLDVGLFGLDPRGHHLVNVLIHLANTLLLFTLLVRSTGAVRRAFLVAALFGVHPLHVESVAWIAERKDVLSTFLGFLAVHAHCRYARKPGLRRYLAIALLLAAGLAAKQMLVTLPGLLLLLDFWPLGRLSRSSWRLPVLEKIPLLALAAAFGVVTVLAQGSGGAFSAYPPAARVSNALLGYLAYVRRAAAPADLAVFYPHPQTAASPGLTLAALLCLAIATALALLSAMSRSQLGHWQSNLTLFSQAARVAPGNWTAHFQLGAWYQRHGRDAEAVAQYRAAIRARDGFSEALNNLGMVLARRGDGAQAEALYRAAVRADPKNGEAHNNLGGLLLGQGRHGEAEASFLQALRLKPGALEPRRNLGLLLLRERRWAEAAAHLREARRLSPGDAGIRAQLAEAIAGTRAP